jgi:hypothetical protein
LPGDEGYMGDSGLGPDAINSNSPDVQQGGTDPIF